MSSPRRWGCFHERKALTTHIVVFPTQVGVFPHRSVGIFGSGSLPHAGGGVSLTASIEGSASIVFPTQVGVFLALCSMSKRGKSLPHAGGGVSSPSITKGTIIESSPRRWGCFHADADFLAALGVFPTQVGVFPPRNEGEAAVTSLPHAGGGVSV